MSAPQPPYDEPPILIEQLQVASLYHYDESNTSAEERRPLYPEEVWLELADVPSVPPAQSAYPGTLSYPVRGISNVALAPVPGNAQRFAAATPGQFANMVPANYSDGAYRPTLRDATGRVVLYSPTVWIADGVRQVVEFQSSTPTQLGLKLPLSISYWSYVGLFPEPGGGSGLTAVDNVGAAGGDVWESTTGNVAHLRRLIPDPTVGRAGTTVETSGQNIRIGTSLTGENLGANPSAQVFSAKSVAGNLQFRRLTAGANVTLTQNANDIVIAASGGGGGGGVTGGANLGEGAGVFDGLNVDTLEFRSLAAGPGLGITADAPTVGEIQITADEVDADGAQLVPDDLEVYINATTGNDTTGDGEALTPFASLARAVREVRVVGYNNTASIIVQAAGGPLTLPAGKMGLDFGTRGARNNPVELRGELQTVNSSLEVLTGAADSVTGQWSITVAAAPPTPFAMGQLVRFTTGVLAGLSVFISQVLSTTEIRLAVSTPGIVVADQFDVVAPASQIQYTSVTVYGGPSPLLIANMRMVGVAGAISSFISFGLPLNLNGVWWQNLATAGYLRNTDVRLGVGLAASVNSAGGAFFDGTAGGTAFLIECQGPARLAGCVAHGNGSEANLKIVGQITELANVFAFGIGSIEIAEQSPAPYSFNSVWIADSLPGPATAEIGEGALSLYSGAAASATRVRVSGSNRGGISVSSNAALTIDTATVFGCASAAYTVSTGAYMSAGADVFAHEGVDGSNGPGFLVSSQGRLYVPGSLEVRHNFDNVAVTNGGKMTVDGDLTCSDANASGVVVYEDGNLYIGGALTTTANGGHGTFILLSTVTAGDFTSHSNNQTSLLCINSHFTVDEAVEMFNTTDAIVFASNSTLLWADGPVSIHDSTNPNSAFVLSVSKLTSNALNFNVFDNSGIGIEVISASSLSMPLATLDVSTNDGGGIDASESDSSSTMDLTCAVLTAVDNGGYGVRMFGGRAYVARGATFSSSLPTADGGLYLGNNAAFRCGDLTADLPNMPAVVSPDVGAVVYVAENSSLTVSADAAAGTTGTLSATSTSANALIAVGAVRGGRIDADTVLATMDPAAASALAAVRLSASALRVTGSVTASNCLNGGITLTFGSTMTTGSAVTLSGNSIGLTLQSGSSATVAGITAVNAGAGPFIGINMTSARLVSTAPITLEFWGTGIGAIQSDLVLTTVAASNCTTAGVSLTNSNLRTSGGITASSNGTGLVATRGSTISCTTATADSNTVHGISLSQSSLNASGTITTGSNTSRGSTLVASSMTTLASMVADSNGGRNISLEGSTLNVGTTLTANGSTNAEGLFMSNSTARAAGFMTISSNVAGNLAATNSLVECSSTSASTMSTSGGTGIELTASKIQFVGNLTANGNADRGVRATSNSAIVVVPTITAKGNGDEGIYLTDSTLAAQVVNVGDAGTAGNFNVGIGLRMQNSLTQTTASVTASHSSNVGIFVNESTLKVATTITASSNAAEGLYVISGIANCSVLVTSLNGTNGVYVERDGHLTTSSLTAANNLTRGMLVEKSSVVNINSLSTVTCNDGTTGILVRDRSSLRTISVTISLAAATLASTALRVDSGSQVSVNGALTINSAFTSPVVITGGSAFESNTFVGTITRTAATPAGIAEPAILVDAGSSAVYSVGVNVASVTTLTPAVANVLVRSGSTAVIAGGTIANGPGDGIEIATRSGLNLTGVVAGTGNLGVGLRLSDHSAAHVVAATTITGVIGDVLVGANAVKTWANIASGQLQHINDFSFPGGGAPTATSVSEMCVCTAS